MAGTRDWDAGTYDRVSAPQLEWGREVLERLELGGEGNVAGFYAAVGVVAAAAPYARYLAGFDPHRFADAAETERLLAAAGFIDVQCRLQPWPIRPPEPREFIRSVCIGAHAERLPEHVRGGFLDAVMSRLGDQPELDYVRLNISARRGAAPASP